MAITLQGGTFGRQTVSSLGDFLKKIGTFSDADITRMSSLYKELAGRDLSEQELVQMVSDTYAHGGLHNELKARGLNWEGNQLTPSTFATPGTPSNTRTMPEMSSYNGQQMGSSMAEFLRANPDIANQSSSNTRTLPGTTPTPTPSTPTAPATPSFPASSYTGGSIVDYLKSIGQASDYNSRAALAQQMGIQNYSGTANQNTQLLSAMRSSSSAQPSGQAPTGPTAPTQNTTNNPDMAYQGTDATDNESYLTIMAGQYPFLADQLNDPAVKSQLLSLPADLLSTYIQLAKTADAKIEAGQVINPDIELSPSKLATFISQASSELDPYFQEVINNYKTDFSTYYNRAQQDYETAVARRKDPFSQALQDQSEGEAGAGTAFSSGRVNRERQLVTGEQNTLDDMALNLSRGVQDTARSTERQLGSNNFSGITSLMNPTANTYKATNTGYTSGDTRTLFSTQGGLMGELPKSREVAVRGRATELEDAYRRNRILDLSSL